MLRVSVTAMVLAACMGSGIGTVTAARGDYDIVTSNTESVAKYGLDKIRFGDLVALMGQENSVPGCGAFGGGKLVVYYATVSPYRRVLR